VTQLVRRDGGEMLTRKPVQDKYLLHLSPHFAPALRPHPGTRHTGRIARVSLGRAAGKLALVRQAQWYQRRAQVYTKARKRSPHLAHDALTLRQVVNRRTPA